MKKNQKEDSFLISALLGTLLFFIINFLIVHSYPEFFSFVVQVLFIITCWLCCVFFCYLSFRD